MRDWWCWWWFFFPFFFLVMMMHPWQCTDLFFKQCNNKKSTITGTVISLFTQRAHSLHNSHASAQTACTSSSCPLFFYCTCIHCTCAATMQYYMFSPSIAMDLPYLLPQLFLKKIWWCCAPWASLQLHYCVSLLLLPHKSISSPNTAIHQLDGFCI